MTRLMDELREHEAKIAARPSVKGPDQTPTNPSEEEKVVERDKDFTLTFRSVPGIGDLEAKAKVKGIGKLTAKAAILNPKADRENHRYVVSLEVETETEEPRTLGGELDKLHQIQGAPLERSTLFAVHPELKKSFVSFGQITREAGQRRVTYNNWYPAEKKIDRDNLQIPGNSLPNVTHRRINQIIWHLT